MCCLSDLRVCNVGITDGWDYVEMGTGGMIYVPSFIKTGSGFQKLFLADIHMQTHGQQEWQKPNFILFFKN
jgi:hypothetical protein